MNTEILLKQFNPRTPLQEQDKNRMLGVLEEYGTSLYLREDFGHITVSALILNPTLDKILMIHHNIYQSYGWVGGHADGEEDLFEVILKEIREETGVEKFYPVSRQILSAEILPVIAHIKKGKEVRAHTHYNMTFGFICPENQPLRHNPAENSGAAWIDIHQLEDIVKEEHMLPVYRENIAYFLCLMDEKQANYPQLPLLLLPWYKKNARDLPWRRRKDPYAIWLSEIMLQQTRVDTVIDYYNRFLKEFPTVFDLAQGEEERVLKLWEGLGYYSRARNLHKAAKIIAADYKGEFPQNINDIAKLPGIGSYTAGAIASIAFNQPCPAVDGNVLRVVSRITEDYRNIDDDRVKKEMANALAKVYPEGDCGDFTQSLMELGATVCLPNGAPLCAQCPAGKQCLANRKDAYEYLPVRKEKTAKKKEVLTFFVLQSGRQTAVQKRREKGVLKDMWELPNVRGLLSEGETRNYLQGQGAADFKITGMKKGNHIFTHIRWDIVCYYVTCKNPFGEYQWIEGETLERDYSVPQAFKKFLSAGQ